MASGLRDIDTFAATLSSTDVPDNVPESHTAARPFPGPCQASLWPSALDGAELSALCGVVYDEGAANLASERASDPDATYGTGS